MLVKQKQNILTNRVVPYKTKQRMQNLISAYAVCNKKCIIMEDFVIGFLSAVVFSIILFLLSLLRI